MLARLLRFPSIVTPDVGAPARVRTGKFCRSFEPTSRSAGSLGVTPSPSRSMPRVVLDEREFPNTAFPVVMVFILTPSVPLLEIRLPAPAVVPPTVFWWASLIIPTPAQ